jgi:hypothetical protein
MDKITRYYGNDALAPTVGGCGHKGQPKADSKTDSRTSWGGYRRIHDTPRPTDAKRGPKGKRIRCLATGKVYPSVSAAALAEGVTSGAISLRIKQGKYNLEK